MKTDYLLASTMLLAVSIIPAVAVAGASLPPADHLVDAVPTGVVSLRDLAAHPAATVRNVINLPRHRLPGFAQNRAKQTLPFVPGNSTVVAPKGMATGFAGIYDGSNAQAIGGELEPPDQGLAVNNGQVVEIINNSIQVFDSSGNALSQPVNNATFFGTGTQNLSDPHVVFDASTQRWFVEELIYSNTFTGFAMAVSQTADPLGKYYLYKVSADTTKISGCGSARCLPDYPQVGFDGNAFFIAADLFSNSTGSFVNAALYVLPKATLEAGGKIKYPYFQLPEFVVQPAIPAAGQPFDTDNNGTEYLMTARNIYDGSTNVRVYAVTNTANITSNPKSVAVAYGDVAVEAYTGTVPSTEPDVIGPYGQSVGATSAPQLDGGYNAFGGGVKYAGTNLYGALATGATDSKGLQRDVVAWFSITPTVSGKTVTAAVAAQGYIAPPSGFSLSYPDMALTKAGSGIIGGTITNPKKSVAGGFPSTCYVTFTGTATSKKIKIVGQGATSDDGFTGYSGSGPAGVGRWGDYGGGTVDPVTGSYYVANEYIPDPAKYPRGTYANWGTFITKYK